MIPPEAYLSLLHGTQSECVQSEHSRYSDPKKDRTLRFLSALALLCVSKRGEAYAIGLRLLGDNGPAPVTLFIAGNDTVPIDTQRHIQSVFNDLADIACHQPPPPKHGIWDESLVQMRDALQLKIFKFCYKKIEARWSKRQSGWEEYSAKYRSYIETNPKFVPHLEMFDEIVSAISDGHWALSLKESKFQESERLGMLADVMKGLSRLMDIPHIRDMIHEIDMTMLATSDWPLERYIDKITAHSRCLDTIVRVAISVNLGHFFRQKPNLVPLPPQSLTVSFEVDSIRERFPDAFTGKEPFISSEKLKDLKVPYKSNSHCELTILAHFTLNRLFGVYPFIGVSKLSCFGCRLGLDVVNACLAGGEPLSYNFPRHFSTAGAHNKVYPHYAYPKFFKEEEMNTNVKERLTVLAEEHFETCSNTHKARRSDSTVSSETDSGTTVGFALDLLRRTKGKRKEFLER